MEQKRVKAHPILEVVDREDITFFWNNQKIQSHAGETLSSALMANGIHIFGHHAKDQAPLGIFCANGQCSQCMVVMNGKSVKACMTMVQPEIEVFPAEGLPVLPEVNISEGLSYQNAPVVEVPVLIIGGGPAGLSAAIELGNLGIKTLLVDDKYRLGGKLVLQTHRFFGSSEAVYAGTRGIEIASLLDEKVRANETIDIWLESTAVAVYEDKSVGIWREGLTYMLVRPEVLLVATGARERSLAFSGNTLPGVYGAGAFQTMVNRDLVRPSEKLFIVGGGNVGLIAGYHALQAGIDVVGLVEALAACGGYKVHLDKLMRMGVPIFTSHTILSAFGKDGVEGVIITAVDDHFKPIAGTEKEFKCDTVLIAVGLNPVNEFIQSAEEVGLPVFSAGDAQEIAEASAAMFAGKIKGLEIAHKLGVNSVEIPEEWFEFEEILKSKPGSIKQLEHINIPGEVYPVMHCSQEIPCDPCSTVCPKNLIHINTKDIRQLPEFCPEEEKSCIACERCVAICPGLAITLVDYRKDPAYPTISIPYEFSQDTINEGDLITVTDVDGEILDSLPVTKIRQVRGYQGTLIVRVKASIAIATRIAGIKVREKSVEEASEMRYLDHVNDQTYICRCERITAGEIRALIREGVRDINQIKAITKASMGACGGKTCLRMIENLFREEGIPLNEVSPTTIRPVFVEMPLDTLAGLNNSKD
jgi:sarcosine oxidase subunit alpha